MKQKILLIMGIIAVLPMVIATTTITTPAASSTVSGVVTFNITISGHILHDDLANLSFYAKSASTANSTWSLLGTNASVNFTDTNSTLRAIDLTGVIEDANDYIFNVTLYNESVAAAFLSEDTNTGITVDNTVPQAPSSLKPDANSLQTNRILTFSGTVTGENTTACTLYFTKPTTKSYTMTHSGDTCSYTYEGLTFMEHRWYIQASDGTNTTDSSTISFHYPTSDAIDVQEPQTNQTVTYTQETPPQDKNTSGWIILIAIGVISFMVYWFRIR